MIEEQQDVDLEFYEPKVIGPKALNKHSRENSNQNIIKINDAGSEIMDDAIESEPS